MYCIVEKVVLPPLSEEDRKALLEKAALVSVYEILDSVPDPRGKHGKRYELSFLLTCLLAARLCNCNSTEAVAQWCREQREVLGQVFGARAFLTPSGSLYRKLLPRLDAQVIEEDGETGHEVAASPDGKRAFVPIYGNSGVGHPGTDGRLLRVIDLGTRRIVGTVEGSV